MHTQPLASSRNWRSRCELCFFFLGGGGREEGVVLHLRLVANIHQHLINYIFVSYSLIRANTLLNYLRCAPGDCCYSLTVPWVTSQGQVPCPVSRTHDVKNLHAEAKRDKTTEHSGHKWMTMDGSHIYLPNVVFHAQSLRTVQPFLQLCFSGCDWWNWRLECFPDHRHPLRQGDPEFPTQKWWDFVACTEQSCLRPEE